MQIHTSDNPAKEAAAYISKTINSHSGDILCLLSGGSALDVVEYLTPNKSQCRTIFIMGDERVSRESTINNYLQLTSRYSKHPLVEHLVTTVPELNESSEDFAIRIENIISKIISEGINLKIISLLGIGNDGHTAGIFPMDLESFHSTYRDDRTYVSVHVEGLKIDSRASITPTWLLEHTDEIFLYAAGESKYTILESLINESKELHERPSELIKQHKNAHLFTDLFIEPK